MATSTSTDDKSNQERDRRGILNLNTACILGVGLIMAGGGEINSNSNYRNTERFFEYYGFLDREGNRLVGSGTIRVEVVMPAQAENMLPKPYMNSLPKPGDPGVVCFLTEYNRIIPVRAVNTYGHAYKPGQKGSLDYTIDQDGTVSLRVRIDPASITAAPAAQGPDLNTTFNTSH